MRRVVFVKFCVEYSMQRNAKIQLPIFAIQFDECRVCVLQNIGLSSETTCHSAILSDINVISLSDTRSYAIYFRVLILFCGYNLNYLKLNMIVLDHIFRDLSFTTSVNFQKI